MAITRSRPAGASDPDLMMLERLVPQLCGASPLAAVGMVASLSMRQRAHLAVFCYARVHLRPVGVAIAATCSLDALLRAAPSDACAHALHEGIQAEAEAVKLSYRRPVTLATSAGSAPRQLVPDLADDEAGDRLPAESAAGNV